jgi:hypothetical protein
MIKFFFHTEAESRVTDTQGTELANMAEARVEAARIAGVMLGDAAPKFWGTRPWVITVTDAVGLIFFGIEVSGFSAPAAGTA